MGSQRRDLLKLGLAGGIAAGAASLGGAAAPAHAHVTDKGERRRLLSAFACNAEMWFGGLPFLERLNGIAALDFTYFEMWSFNNKNKGDTTPQQIAARMRELGLTCTSISPGSPDLTIAENLPGFLDAVRQAIELSQLMGVKRFNMTGHKLVEGLTLEQMGDNYVRALEAAIPLVEAADLTLMVEPYNPFNHPGHFIQGVFPGVDLIQRVNSPRVKMMWDLFHMQRTNGNLITHMTKYWDLVDYIQFADSPDRHQPGTGEIAYGLVFEAARELGYTLPFGAELKPKDNDDAAAANALIALAQAFDLSVRSNPAGDAA